MKSTYFICVIAASLFIAQTVSKSIPLKKQEEDGVFTKVYNNVEVVKDIAVQILGASFFGIGNPYFDPIEFKNFTFYVMGVIDIPYAGEGHTFLPLLHGLKDMQRQVIVNNETKNVYLEAVIPLAITTGLYDYYLLDQFCIPIIGCSDPFEYKGEGAYNHTFNDVKFTANFTLKELNPTRIVVSDLVSTFGFGDCLLGAENFTVNGQPVDMVGLSESFKRSFENDYLSQREVVRDEAFTWMFNSMWGVQAWTMVDVIEQFQYLAEIIDESNTTIAPK